MRLSVILCTHRPDPVVIGRTLQAIGELRWPADAGQEIVVVDNASPEPLAQEPYVKDWLARTPGVRLVREDRLGLSFARARAFREASGDWIVCFDDDNAPHADYLLGVVAAVAGYPFVGVWGAGNITVDWLPGGDPKVMAQYAGIFQQRTQVQVTHTRDFNRPNEMPYGTGMALARVVADRYAAWVESGESRITDRQGTALSSAGDIQIGWLAMLNGWAVGRHPALRLRHLVPARRARMDYVARLTFGMASSYAPARREMLSATAGIMPPVVAKLAGRLVYDGLLSLVEPQSPPFAVRAAKGLGSSVGRWTACGQIPPWWVRRLTRKLYGDGRDPRSGKGNP